MNLIRKQLCFLSMMLAAASMHAAHAQSTMQPLQTSNFLMTEYPEYYGNSQAQKVTLLSDAGGVTTLGMTSLASSLSMDTQGTSMSNGDLYTGVFDISVRNGYRVTGFSFAATLVGVLQVAEAPAGASIIQPGNASNSGSMEALALTGPHGQRIAGESFRQESLDGTQDILLQGVGLSLTDPFTMFISGMSYVNAQLGQYRVNGPDYSYDGSLPAYASYRLVNPTLTIFTSPVPEPGTYAMLLAGLALCGAAGLRRRRGARSGTPA